MLSIVCLVFTNHFIAFAQDSQWWNELHNWDGVSSWKEYITYSSKYMGPNALPVPEINAGEFSRFTELELGLEQHLSPGDKTFNLLANVFLPVVKDRVGLRVNYRPVEFYEMDTVTRNERAARDYDPSGYSFGDIYFSTLIQVIKNHEKLPDLMLSINLKTASGTNLGNARHTDAPGYYFDASTGKTFQTGNKIITSWRPYFMWGFYSYQTNRNDYLQNDAFLYGIGFRVETPVVWIENQVGGYLGYFGNGDQPAVYRLKFNCRRESLLNCKLGFQIGLHDFPYYSVCLSGVLRFEELKFFWGNEESQPAR